MQKLENQITQSRFSQGSVLVGAVVFSLIVGIITAGYLMITQTTGVHEQEALDNDNKFLAAESGLYLGISWLSNPVNFNGLAPNQAAQPLFNFPLNGMQVAVSYIFNGVNVRVISRAQGGQTGGIKQLTWTVALQQNKTGFFLNAAPQNGPGGGGFNNVWFDGPYHSNTPIYLAAVANPNANGAGVCFVNGNVSVSNQEILRNFQNNQNGGHWGNYGATPINDFSFGIFKHNLQQNTNEANRLQEHFTNPNNTQQISHFRHTQPKRSFKMPQGETYLLPPNNSNQNEAILYFDVQNGIGRAQYYTFNGNNAVWRRTIPNIDGQVIRCQNNVRVLGTIQGKTTVVTNANCNITVAGDLTYNDFNANNPIADYQTYNNANNYGISRQSQNALGLISGADIVFVNQKMRFNTQENRIELAGGGDDQVLTLTAVLYATNKGNGIQIAPKINDLDYTLRAIGARTVDTWFNYDAGGVNSNRTVRFFHDSRFSQGNIELPGMMGVIIIKGDGQQMLAFRAWAWGETNSEAVN